jgi:cytochrome c biogenesis protein CcmG/thiol:disulfide interchange protein DsbE
VTAVADPPVDAPGPDPIPPRRRHTARWIAVCTGVVVLLFAGLLATRKPADRTRADSPLLGRAAPATEGPIVGGAAAGTATPGTATLSSLSGKFVLVNFFASWCIPCQQEEPVLKAFDARHTATGDAAVMGISYGDTAANVRSYMSDHGDPWPVIDSVKAKVDWGVRGVPESFLVDPSGVVLFHFVGAVKAADLEGALREAQAAQQAAAPHS